MSAAVDAPAVARGLASRHLLRVPPDDLVSPLPELQTFEALLWVMLLGVAGLLFAGTLGAEFPARPRALAGEAFVIVSAVLFALALRVVLLLPLLSVFLIVAAAGFAA